jgi:integrase
MALRWEHFDAAQGLILAMAETQKQLADQLLPVSPQTVAALEAIRGDRPEIFPWPYDRWAKGWNYPTLHRRFRRLLKAAGLPATRKDQFHSIRRTTASYIKAAGGDATWQLGHSGPKVTEVYYDPRIVQRARQVDLLPRPSVGASGVRS